MNPAPILSCQAIFFRMPQRQVDQFALPAVGWAHSPFLTLAARISFHQSNYW